MRSNTQKGGMPTYRRQSLWLVYLSKRTYAREGAS